MQHDSVCCGESKDLHINSKKVERRRVCISTVSSTEIVFLQLNLGETPTVCNKGSSWDHYVSGEKKTLSIQRLRVLI